MDLYQYISSSHNNNFPIIAFALIGILATAFLLIGYYLFVIKSCHFIDFLPCFLYSRRRNDVYPVMVYSVAVENRGLDESVIRAIPIFQFKKPSPLTDNVDQDFKGQQGRFCCECSVCLNEFQEDENLRIIPNCGHVFHIDCIDIWLQNNRNCPLCRASVSSSSNANQLFIPSTPIHGDNPSTGHENDAGFVVIEMQGENSVQDQRLNSSRRQNRSFSRKLLLWEKSSVPNKRVRKMGHVSSMGDECIDIRRLDDGFTIEQPIRRSFSMDSSNDRQLCLGIQEMLKQNTRMHNSHRVREASPVPESCSSSSRRVRRSFFSFGSGRGSRNANLPVHFEI